MSSYNFKKSENGLVYSFISTGPKGQIEKVVGFDLIDNNKTNNLSLADRKGDRLEDVSLSNNGDIFKIFNTIAEIFTDFVNDFTNVRIFFEGNTLGKNVSYARTLTNRLAKIYEQGFIVQGYIDGNWESYKKGQNYEAFLLTRTK